MTLFRDRKGLIKRKSRYRDPYTLYVIASEGTETEPLYFSYLQDYVSRHQELNRLVKIEPLSRKLKNDTSSDSAHILELLDDFNKKFSLKAGDELWLLLHLKDIRDYSPQEHQAFLENAKWIFSFHLFQKLLLTPLKCSLKTVGIMTVFIRGFMF